MFWLPFNSYLVIVNISQKWSLISLYKNHDFWSHFRLTLVVTGLPTQGFEAPAFSDDP